LEDLIMKNILLVVAMLIIVSPVLATVSVTATDIGGGVVEVRYNCSAGEKVRSFALDISVNNGMTIDSIYDFNVGENNATKKGYGIFPGSFADYINPASPNWADVNYKPVAPVADPNARTGLGTGAITVEMGSLYVDTNAPPSSGQLFKLGINPHSGSSCNLSIVLNNTRVGVVLEDTSVVASPVLTGTTVSFNILVYCAVGVCGGTSAINAAITTAGFTPGTATPQYSDTVASGCVISQSPVCGTVVPPGTTINYVYSIGRWATPSQILYPTYDSDCLLPIYWSAVAGSTRYELERSGDGGGIWTNVYTGTATFKADSVAAGNYLYRVKAANADSNSLYITGANCNAYLSVCYANGNTSDPNWGQWVSVGRPDCWCKASSAQEPNGSGYQCDGDVDGTSGGAAYRVYTLDQTAVVTNWKKTAAQLTNDPNLTFTGKYKIHAACADIDHKSGGAGYRVYTLDQTAVVTNWKKTNSSTSTATNRLPGNCPR
jgi:hypothetical protein